MNALKNLHQVVGVVTMLLLIVSANTTYCQQNPSWQELMDQRTRDSKTFIDENGTYHLSKTAGSFHFKNEQDVWEDIQSEIHLTPDGTQAGIFRSDLPIVCDLSSGEVNHTLVKNGEQLITGIDSRVEVWSQNQTIITTQGHNQLLSNADFNQNILTHHNYYDGIDRIQRYQYFEVGNDFLIQNRPTNLPENSFLVFTEKWKMPQGFELEKVEGIETESGWNGLLVIKNHQGEILAKITKPIYYDAVAAEGDIEGEIHSATGTFVITQVEDGYIVSVLVPSDWLLREEIVYPVTIDPTLSNTYATNQGLQDWQSTFNANCQATMSITLPAGGSYSVTNTSTQYTIRAKGTIVVSGLTTYYAAGFEQRSRVGYNTNWTPTQFGFGDSMNPQDVPYSIFSSTIANGCYPGGTTLPFKWQGYQVYFPDYSGPFQATVSGCTTNYDELLANTWVVTITYDVFQLDVVSTPAAPIICSGSPAGISLTSIPAGATFSYTNLDFGVTGSSSGSGNSIQHLLSTTSNAPGYVSYTVTPTLNNCIGTPHDILVTVNPEYILPVVNAQICAGETYSFSGNTYSTTGLYTLNLQTDAGCDSIVSLNLNVVNTLSTTLNESICDGDDYYFNGDFYSDAGTYVADLISIGGCDSIVTLNLTVNPTYESFINEEMCQGTTYTFDNIDYTTSGTYPHVYQTAAGCDSIITITLIVNPPFTITTNVTICEGLTYDFEGQTYSTTGNYQEVYSTASGCDSIMELNLVVTPVVPYHFNIDICDDETYSFNGQSYNSTGVYTSQLQTALGCDSTAVLHLTVHPSDSISQNVSICDGQVHLLGGVPYSTTGTYIQDLQTAFGCDSIVTLNLTVNPIPNVDIGDQFDLCEGETVVLSNIVQANNYNWSTGSTSPTITVSASGMYKLIIGGVGNCNGIDSAQVIVHPLPGGFVDSQRTLCDGEELFLDGGNPANEYLWSTGETTQAITIDRSGDYSVLITSPFGCEKQFSFEVGYFCEPIIFVPNSFTPNGDGVNDEFRVYGEFIAELELVIFDRWGEKIFVTKDIKNPVWTGGISGGENHYVTDGFYSWRLNYKFFTDTFGGISDWKDLKGTVTIVR